MKDFFKVSCLAEVMEHRLRFKRVGVEEISLLEALGRVIAADLVSTENLPPFPRATMDGFAVRASATFGASASNPTLLNLVGTVPMGQKPLFSVGLSQAAKISTGGMLPPGADGVVMIEYTEALDDFSIEVCKGIAPGQHIIEAGEDFGKDELIIQSGASLRAQEIGLLAAFGRSRVNVYRRPVIGVISTGDEITPIDALPEPGQIRDINTYTLAALIAESGGVPKCYGIVADDKAALYQACLEASAQCDMTLVSGGSSVGARDYAIEVFSSLPQAQLLTHGISISPGKPTILAMSEQKALWGLPGHVASAMIVFRVVVRPFIEHIAGRRHSISFGVTAELTRNIASAQGRTEYIRVRLISENGRFFAEPVLGKSGLINTMIKGDGVIEIGLNVEGLEKGTPVMVQPI